MQRRAKSKGSKSYLKKNTCYICSKANQEEGHLEANKKIPGNHYNHC